MRAALLVFTLLLATEGTFAGVLDVFRFTRDSLIAPEVTRTVLSVPFDPDEALRNRRSYQSMFGYRGKDVIYKFGLGYRREDLVRIGAVTP